MTNERIYPLDIRGELDPNLSRGLWLIKWLLAIPHYIVITALSFAALFLWIVAFFAVLITGRYPQGIFGFNVGVMRWTWRVAFYAGLLGTDRYPPFSLQADDDYPADISVQYPERLSRLQVIFKWWLLPIPHLIIVSSLNSIASTLSIFAGVVLLFTGRYPADMFHTNMGINRWKRRLTGYTSFFYDDYPPFRFTS